jgi:hypothetical protein
METPEGISEHPARLKEEDERGSLWKCFVKKK